MQEFMLGNTKVIINDRYCRGQTEEQREKILQRVSEIACEALFRQMKEESRDEKKVEKSPSGGGHDTEAGV